MNEKYVLVKLSDLKELASAIKEEITDNTGPYAYVFGDVKYRLNKSKVLLDRIEAETGADMIDIVNKLKKLGICGACEIESQEHSCNSLYANRLGRRLSRLVDRANATEVEAQAVDLPEQS